MNNKVIVPLIVSFVCGMYLNHMYELNRSCQVEIKQGQFVTVRVGHYLKGE